MPLSNSFWTYIAFGLITVLAVLAFAIRDSSITTSSNTSKGVTNNSFLIQGDEVSTVKVSEKTVSSDFPAPAKKLHQLIRNTDNQVTDSHIFDEKVKQLDKQLTDINQQLKGQGVNAPQRESKPSIVSVSNTEKRLSAIKEHIENKNLSID